MRRPILTLVLAVVVASCAQSQQTYRLLEGLKPIKVVVEEYDDYADLEHVHLTVEQIQIETELLLRTVGLDLVDKDADSGFAAYLYVNVNASDSSALAIYSVELQFKAYVNVEGNFRPAGDPRNPSGYATIWDSGMTGYASSDRSNRAVIDALKLEVATFANDYLKANPKD